METGVRPRSCQDHDVLVPDRTSVFFSDLDLKFSDPGFGSRENFVEFSDFFLEFFRFLKKIPV